RQARHHTGPHREHPRADDERHTRPGGPRRGRSRPSSLLGPRSEDADEGRGSRHVPKSIQRRRIATMHSSFIVLAGAPLDAADAMSALEYLGLAPDMAAEGDPSPPVVRIVVPRDPARDLAGTCGADADGPR